VRAAAGRLALRGRPTPALSAASGPTPAGGQHGADERAVFARNHLTDTLRQALYLYVDVFLPYYVASRGLRQISDFKDAMLAFVLAGFVLALIGVAEFVRHWLLYNALLEAMGVHGAWPAT
jgi:hypothetical protein